MAARRHGIKTFILPKGNQQDLAELPDEVRRDMTFVPAETLQDVLRVALPDVVTDAETPAAGSSAGSSAAAAASNR